jgi:hypothetical protein
MPLPDRIDLDEVPPSFRPFPRPVPLAAGEALTVRVENTDTELFFDLDTPSDA